MATLVELQARRDALAAAIASGAMRVEDQFGRSVMYRSLAEMRSVLAGIDAEISVSQGTTTTTRGSRYRYATSTCKGL